MGEFTWVDAGAIAAIGLMAGTLGGLLGVGGSVIMIPALTAIFGPEQHLYQAAAMAVNVGVAVPAAWRHHGAGAARRDVLRAMLPAAVVAVLAGVGLSNLFQGEAAERWLKRLFALLLAYVVWVNIARLRREIAGRHHAASGETPAAAASSRPAARSASAGVGGVMGLTAGLLGVGGGAIAVPLQQIALRLPLRSCIANSAIVMVFSAAIGAVMKIATLPGHGVAPRDALLLAALLAPTAILGGRLGASLTHRLPLWQVRLAFVALMIAAALKMAGLG